MADQPTTADVNALLPFANAYIAGPFNPADNLGPPVPSQRINDAYFLPNGTINDANRTDFATISASANIGDIFLSGGSQLMPAPTFKGTYFFDQSGGGSSQSYYAVEGAPNAPTNFATMMAAMKTLGRYRSALSQTVLDFDTTNPLRFTAIRVDDVRTRRKGQTETQPQISLATFSGSFDPNTVVSDENDQPDACYKVTFSDSLGNSSIMYFHGVPIASQLTPQGQADSRPRPFFESRFPDIDPQWLVNLNIFTNNMRLLGLGLRYTTVQWTPQGLPLDGQAGTGNGTPIAVFYGRAGTGPQTYTFSLSTPVAPVLGKFRVILRGFQNMKVLNGRHPAVGFIDAGVYYVNVRMNAPNYLPWDSFGYLSPEIFSTFQPSPAAPISQGDFSGVSGVVYTSHKVGRPFGQARGRRARVNR